MRKTRDKPAVENVPMRTGSAYGYAIVLLSFLWLPLSSPACAQTRAAPAAQAGTPEQRAARAFERARANPLELRAFLVRMPKGGDLHNHLDGAVYAESRIRAAAQDHLCVALARLSFTNAVRLTQSDPPNPVCAEGQVPAAQAYSD